MKPLCPKCGFSEEEAWEAGYEAGREAALGELRSEVITNTSGTTAVYSSGSANLSAPIIDSFMKPWLDKSDPSTPVR